MGLFCAFRGLRRAGVAVAAVAVLVLSACGSDGVGTAGKVPAGAKENAALVLSSAAGDAVCSDWPKGTVAKPCAVGLKGPGGGRVFYDAGSPQAWGRFLEVAPQDWNGDLYECPGSGLIGSTCGSADKTIARATGDFGPNEGEKTRNPGDGYHLCRKGDPGYLEPSVAPATSVAYGAGRANTDALHATGGCDDGTVGAVERVRGYRGGGLDDWYLAAQDELVALCNFGGRDGVGGFPDKQVYVSSSLYEMADDFVRIRVEASAGSGASEDVVLVPRKVQFNDNCEIQQDKAKALDNGLLVRPIRAF